MTKKLFFVLIPTLLLTSVFIYFLPNSTVMAKEVSSSRRVRLCHATSSHRNPYNNITVDHNAVFSQGHDTHTGSVWYEGIKRGTWGDIIPPFEYQTRGRRGNLVTRHYEGLNWSEIGQAVWENGCNIPKKCAVVEIEEGVWSDWFVDPENSSLEYRERTITEMDAFGRGVCDTEVQRENKYIICSITETIYSEWSEWEVDPEDDSREYRERIVNTVDSEDNEILCDDPVMETEYRDIDDTGDVEGVTDERKEEEEGEVLGTAVVYAKTSGGNNSLIFVMQYLLMILTGSSFIVLGKNFLNR